MTVLRSGHLSHTGSITSIIGEQDQPKGLQTNDPKGTQTQLEGEPDPLDTSFSGTRRSKFKEPDLQVSDPLLSSDPSVQGSQQVGSKTDPNGKRSDLDAILDELLAITFDRPRMKEGLFGGKTAKTIVQLQPNEEIDETLMKSNVNKKIEKLDTEKKYITFAENDTFYKLKSDDHSNFGIYVKLYDFTKDSHEKGHSLPDFLSYLKNKEAGYGITHPVEVDNPEKLAEHLQNLKPEHQAICRIYDRKNDRYSLLMITNGRPVLFTDRAKGRNIEYQKAFEKLDCYGIFADPDPKSKEFEQLIRREGPFRPEGTGKLKRLKKKGISNDEYLKQFKVIFEGMREEQQRSIEFRARPGYVHPETLFLGVKSRLVMTSEKEFELQDNVDQIGRVQEIEDRELAFKLQAKEQRDYDQRMSDHEIAKKLYVEMNGPDAPYLLWPQQQPEQPVENQKPEQPKVDVPQQPVEVKNLNPPVEAPNPQPIPN